MAVFPDRGRPVGRTRRWVCAATGVAVLLVGLAGPPGPLGFVPWVALRAQTPSGDGDRPRNFDARLSLAPLPLASPVTAPAALDIRDRALEAFGAGRPNLAVGIDEMFGTTNRLYDRLGYLTDPDTRDPSSIAVDFVITNRAVLGLDAAAQGALVVTDLAVNQATGSTHVYLRQSHLGIPVYNALLHVNVNRDGRILGVNNAWVPGLETAVAAATPAVSAGAAVSRAALHLGLQTLAAPRSLGAPEGPTRLTKVDPAGISTEPIEAELMWLPIRRGDVRLVWNFQIHTADQDHAYDLTVDAASGDVWTRFDWVAGDSYRVYAQPGESPVHLSPAPPADGRTMVSDPADAIASPYGWHDVDGVAGHEYTVMRGNNVHAYEDADGDGVPPASEPDCGPTLTCDFPIDLASAPAQSVPAAVANLFYWNNFLHDSLYRYGFTETAGNFQVNNYGRGGIPNDDVRAEAQDGGGTNNANFLTPGDGARPRMQMFLWTAATPDIDGDFDNGIIVHEYGHGISNRLVGGPASVSCLNNRQQPGEGLSDWWALVYTAAAGDLGTDGRGIGTYALNQAPTGSGIRGRRYSLDPTVNDWTYESISGMTIPHGVGSVWAQAAWEMYWALVNTHGFDQDLMNGTGTAGNQRALLYMNQGLMNSPCSPTFTDVRDGIIQAATDNHGGADACLLWSAFAGMGLGTDAVSGGPDSTTPTNGFGVPAACLANGPQISVTDVSIPEGDSGTASAVFDVTLSAPSAVAVSADYVTVDGTAEASLTTTSNSAPIAIPGSGSSGNAGPYPSSITVPVANLTVTNATVLLTGFSHTYPADVDVLLVGPGGRSVVLMSDAGGSTDVSNLTITFDDTGPAMSTGPLSTGSYRPTNFGSGDSFPSPAPSGPYGTTMSVFNDMNPAGTWQLFVRDDASSDVGAASGGWRLELDVAGGTADYLGVAGSLSFAPGDIAKTVTVEVIGDTLIESDETFLLRLSGSNVTIADAEGLATITNDDVVIRTLTLTRAGTGTGVVASGPLGIDCGGTCSAGFVDGTVVTLTATPTTATSTFGGWGGNCSGSAPTCQVDMSAARDVSATFTLTPRLLTVSTTGTGTGVVTSTPAGVDCGVDCAEPYGHGAAVTLTATATAVTSTFGGWSGACGGSAPSCQVAMTEARDVTATFTLIPGLLTVTRTGTGTGTVTSSPGDIDCGAVCFTSFGLGTTVTLTATPSAATSAFGGWGGACAGSALACQVVMSQTYAVTARFDALPLAAPTSLTATPTSATATSLTWQDLSSGESDFHLERAPVDTGVFTEASMLSANPTTTLDTGLLCGTAYRYRLRAHRHQDGQFSSYSGEALATTLTCPVLPAPTDVAAWPLSETALRLTWTEAVDSETKLHIDRRITGTGDFVEVATVAGGIGSVVSSGLACGTRYEHRIQARRGTDGAVSPYSDPVPDERTLACHGASQARLTLTTAGTGFGTLTACANPPCDTSGLPEVEPRGLACGSPVVEGGGGTARCSQSFDVGASFATLTLQAMPAAGFKVGAVTGVGCPGAASLETGVSIQLSTDLTCAVEFLLDVTDAAASTGSTVRSAHVTDLRPLVNRVRADLGLAAFVFEDASLSAGFLIRAIHFVQLREAVDEAYVRLGMTPPVYSDGLQVGLPPRAVHLTELRAAVTRLQTRIVFVTSALYTGNLGGVSGANQTCNNLAVAAGLTGRYRAWLSDGSRSPGQDFSRSSTFAYVRGVEGGQTSSALIAQNWADLTDGFLNSFIRLDEYGRGVSAPDTWSGTTHLAGPTASNGPENTCNNWTSDDPGVNGWVGRSAVQDWGATATRACDQRARLYCFQQ